MLSSASSRTLLLRCDDRVTVELSRPQSDMVKSIDFFRAVRCSSFEPITINEVHPTMRTAVVCHHAWCVGARLYCAARVFIACATGANQPNRTRCGRSPAHSLFGRFQLLLSAAAR